MAATIEVNDMLIEIFLRLPPSSTKRFETVCKNWQSLLNSSLFRKLWRKRNLSPSTALFVCTRAPVSTQLVPFSPNNNRVLTQMPHFLTTKLRVTIKQSCNGLLLCSAKGRYYVYNPTNDSCHILPKPRDDVTANKTCMGLAFDPVRFGLQYRVVSCVGNEIHVYSSETRVWKLVLRQVDLDLVNDKGVYWNGSIHWMLEFTYFDIEKETLNVFPEPPVNGHWKKDHYLGESCDRLIYAKLYKGNYGNLQSVLVCEMERDYSEWILKYRVEVICQEHGSSLLSVVCGFEEDDDECSVVLKIRNGILRLNLDSRTFEELPALTNHGIIDRAFQFIESQFDV